MEKLYSPKVIQYFADKYGFQFSKKMGQNFLIDGNTIKKIADVAKILPEDVVVEVGPGIGTLTWEIARRCKKVLTIELDRTLLPLLKETLADSPNVEVVHGNALEINLDEIVGRSSGGEYGKGGKPYKLVANLPYYITTPLIMHFLENRYNLKSITIMVQKEVAERITARPGSKDYGSLSLAVQYYCRPEVILKVPSSVFYPRPKVDSAVLYLELRETPPVSITNEKLFFGLIKRAFGKRRKTVINALVDSELGLDKDILKQIFKETAIDPGRRGETLNMDEFARLSNALAKLKNY